MEQVLSLQNMETNEEIELHARSFLSVGCKVVSGQS